MNTHADKTEERQSNAAAHNLAGSQERDATFRFIDNRPEATAQRKLQEMADNSMQAKQPFKSDPSCQRVLQRNAYAAQNYAPPDGRAFQPGFRAQHTPNGNGFSDETAIGIHEIRGNMPVNTLINISDANAIYDIQNELLGLSDEVSNNLVNVERFWMNTSGSYNYIETQLDNEGQPYVSNRGTSVINVRVQWHNAGYYQIYHFGQLGGW